ncbi:hypothetical protein, partial [Paractinoplanes deccanensis]
MPLLPFLTAMLVGVLPVPASPRTAPTFNGSVYAIAHRGDTVYVGGAFTAATDGGRTYQRSRLAAFDARTGRLLDWAPSADGTVRALAATPESVYAAGDFHEVDGEDRDALARLHPSSGAVGSFSHDLSGTAYSLAAGNDRLYLGGSFTAVDGERRRNLAAFDLRTGRLDPRWRPVTDDTVHTLATAGSKLYLGGGFHVVNGVKGTLRLAAVNGVSGAVDPVFRPRVPAEVRAVAIDTSGVQVATAGVGGRAISYAHTGALRWQRVFDGDAAAIATGGGITYVGGHFDAICRTERNGVKGGCVDGSTPRFKLAALTATGTLTGWAPRANGVIGVRVLTVHRGTVAAGGDFTMIDGRDRRRFAA